MRRTIRLTERELSRIVKRVIKEDEGMGDITVAMKFLDQYLEERGGTLGGRRPNDIMPDLKALEHAIRIEKNNLAIAMERPNPNWANPNWRYGEEEEM